MNEMNELEAQLRSWKPRRPSEAVRQRLFGQETPAATHHVPAFRLRWLAPAGFALLLISVLFNHRNVPTFTSSVDSGRMVALIMSNQNAAAYLPGSFPREHNTLTADSLQRVGSSESKAAFTSSRLAQ